MRTQWINVISTESGQRRGPGRQKSSFIRVLEYPQTRWGLILLVVMTIFAVLGPLFAPYGPTEIVGGPYQPPGGGLVFGADVLGRDIWSRVLNGGYNLAWMSLSAAVIGVGLGATVGLAGAYFGGVVDGVLMRVMDGLLAFPPVVFALLFVSMLGPHLWLLVILVGIAHIPGTARVLRGAAQPILNREYIQWAHAVGLPTRHILAREVLPNVTSPLMVEFGLRAMWSVGLLAAISFIGYGIQPPAADWGLMVSENRVALSVQPIAVLVPVVCIALFTIGANLFSEGYARIIARTEGKVAR